MYLKAKTMKMTKDFMGQFEKAGVDLSEFDKGSDIDIINVGISCGEPTEGGMKIDASIYHRGDRFKEQLKTLKGKGVTWLN